MTATNKVSISRLNSSQLDLDFNLPGEITTTAWALPADLSFDEWLVCGKKLLKVQGSVLWWIGDWWAFGNHRYGERIKAFDVEGNDGYKYQTAKDAGMVSNSIERSRRLDLLSWSHHREVAPLEPPDQDRFLRLAVDESLSHRELRKVINDYKLQQRATGLSAALELKGTYSVLVIDPPWPMELIHRDIDKVPDELDYPTLSINEIQEFKFEDGRTIPTIADDDCHLFLWTTQRFLPDALLLLEAWNFNYICTFAWHKSGGFQPYGLPQYNCEFALYARRGNPFFVETTDFFLCFDGPRSDHSRKPACFYETVSRVTAGRRIEIFSREAHPGFDAFGNEAGKFGK